MHLYQGDIERNDYNTEHRLLTSYPVTGVWRYFLTLLYRGRMFYNPRLFGDVLTCFLVHSCVLDI